MPKLNDIYEVAEQGLWKPGFLRTSEEEVIAKSRKGELRICLQRHINGTASPANIVGSISIRLLSPVNGSPRTAEFGTLTVLPTYRSSGVGLQLVNFPENTASEAGCTTMQLELLVPRLPRTHADKEFLKRWYGKLGYRSTRLGSLEQNYPHLVKHANETMRLEIMGKKPM